MSGNSEKLIAFNYFGGKFTWCDSLYPYFPPHEHFVDLFCGSAAVSLNKKPSSVETINDCYSEVVNFFRVLRESPHQLIRALKLTPVSREEYNHSWIDDDCTSLEKARRFYVRSRQGFSGLSSQTANKGWCFLGERRYSKQWYNGIDNLWQVAEKIKTFQIEHLDYKKLMKRLNSKEVFFYQDPPYLNVCRKSENRYKHDWSENDHRELAALNHKSKALIMISSYDCDLYDELYCDWHKIGMKIKTNNLGKTPIQECIWMNYDPAIATQQMQLF